MRKREHMVDERLVREITELVVKELKDRHTKALVIYDDAVTGTSIALEKLRELRDQGFQFDVLMSREAYENQNVEEICNALEPEQIWVRPDRGRLEISVSPYEALLVPTLTVNTVAHLAACMTDSPVADVIMNGLMRGKTVVIAIDASCPDCLEEVNTDIRMAEALKKKLRSNLNALSEFGAKLTKADRLQEITMSLLRQVTSAKAAAVLEERQMIPTKDVAAEQNQIDMFPGKLLSAADVSGYAEGGVIHVKPCTMITQLAQEEARRKRIEIELDE